MLADAKPAEGDPDSGLRHGYGAEDLLHSPVMRQLHAARAYAEQLRQTVVRKGGFEELPVSAVTS